LNDNTETVHVLKTVAPPATTVTDFPVNPSRSGYNFGGWNTAADGSGTPFTASTTVSASITVYAQWTATPPNSYTVTFRLNDNTETVHVLKTVAPPATTVTDFPANPSRSGYTFGGWNTAADGSETPFTASTTVSASITVYAQWDTYSYTVSFNSDDGTTEANPSTKTVASPRTNVETLPIQPAKTGYGFGGWYTEKGGSGTPFTETTTVIADITVYAKWTAHTYTVNFRMNDGSEAVHGTKTVTAPATTVAELPANPSRTGYSFGGWNTAPGGSGTLFTTATTVSGDLTVYAQWNTYSYTVSFNSDDGTTEANPSTKTVVSPRTNVETLPAQPAKTGYGFGGWYTEKGGSGTPFTASTTVSADITVYAKWTANTYTVNFRMNDGSEAVHGTKTVTAPATTVAELPAAPSRPGYSFGGWNTQANGSGTPFTTATTVNASITVYAQWTANTYTVNFRLNDGTETAYAEKTVTVPAATVTDFPANPSRSGYSFGGWNTQANGSGTPFTTATTVSASITVYAQWTANTYTVNFRMNDGTETVHALKTVTAPATTITDFPANPSRSGYSFGGWNTQANGSGTPFTTATIVSASITVYAQWTANTYTVNFRLNDGSEAAHAEKTVTVPATTVTDFPANPSRNGYSFGGWNTQANGSGTPFTTATTVNASITVYAQWNTYSWTVTFNSDGGTAANPATKTVASPDINVGSLPSPPAKTGYLFGGWYTQPNGAGTAFTNSTTVSGSLTVYAKWDTYSHTVSFDSNGGTTEADPATKTVASPATTIDSLPSPPAKTGYLFGGWYTQPNGMGTAFNALTTVSGSLTVYAKWDTYSWTVSFDKNGGDTPAVPATKTVASPNTIIDSLPAEPSRSGHAFVTWNTRQDGTGTVFTAATPVTGDITVYAHWVYSYTVTFNSDGGNTEANPEAKTVTGPATTVDSLPAPPAKTGYLFGGWYTLQNGGGSAFNASTTVSGNITVYAKWNSYSWTVTFNSGGGTTEANPGDKTVASPNTTIDSLPTPPAKTGYLFGGWYTQPSGAGTAFDASTTVSGDTTVYAKWNTYSYAVSFNSDGGTTEANPATKFVNSPATTIDSLPTVPPAKTGYIFGGWYTEPDGGGIAFTTTTTVSDGITVYAKWNTYSYTVSFNNNGGDTAADPATKTVTSPATSIGTLPAPPVRSGYAFAGWNTLPNGTGTPFTATSTVSGNTTVYALWSKAVITFDPDAGDGAFEGGDFTLSKGANDSQTLTITGTGYTNPRWLVDGALKGTGISLTIAAADYRLGRHNLSLLVTKNNVTWSKDIVFTVEN
jgi:uncharacterized repeat protein (TIGR02543 family)